MYFKKQGYYFANKGLYSQSYVFSSGHVWMWELDHKEAEELMLLNCGFGEYSWESLGQQGDQTSQSERSQFWIFIGKTDATAEALILWLPDVKSRLIREDPDAGKDWRWEEKGLTEDEMVGWHHWLNGCEFEQTLGDSEGQGSLAYCSPWSHKELDMTRQLNNNYLYIPIGP